MNTTAKSDLSIQEYREALATISDWTSGPPTPRRPWRIGAVAVLVASGALASAALWLADTVGGGLSGGLTMAFAVAGLVVSVSVALTPRSRDQDRAEADVLVRMEARQALKDANPDTHQAHAQERQRENAKAMEEYEARRVEAEQARHAAALDRIIGGRPTP